MPRIADRFTPRIPSYRRHKASGRGVVTLAGRDLYLPGRWGSAESRAAYDRLMSEFLAAGRRAEAPAVADQPLTVSELLNEYWRWAKGQYVNPANIKSALAIVRRLYGRQPAAAFGPKALRACREYMIREKKWARRHCNQSVSLIRACFKWGVAEELIPPAVHQALQALPGLRRGKTAAYEPDRIGPIADATVAATLAHMPPVPADLVRFIRLTGCRPGEACALRRGDIDTSADPWVATLAEHKTAHRGRERKIFIGPRAADIVRSYLLRGDDEPLFSPLESERKRRGPGKARKPGRPKKRRRPPGAKYRTDSLRRAITRAAEKAGLPPWGPNRLRHSKATELRHVFGLEAAAACLGHADAGLTAAVYAESDWRLAAEAARRTG